MNSNVLIVEDELNLSQMLHDIFKLEGFDVELAYDGDQGIDKARFGMPGVILFDIGLWMKPEQRLSFLKEI